jgi:hypothetical protein
LTQAQHKAAASLYPAGESEAAPPADPKARRGERAGGPDSGGTTTDGDVIDAEVVDDK